MTGSIGDFDGHFDQVRELLTPCARELLALPDCSEVGRNLVSMGNYLPLLNSLLRAVSPSLICEIGAYRGITTRCLAEISAELGARIDVVDPAINSEDAPIKAGHVRYHQMLSEQYLATPRNVDVFFIDGDHNHEVVSKELELIVAHRGTADSAILIMHDVGWPCAYRDMYYDLSRILQPQPVIKTSRVSMTIEGSKDFEISLPRKVDFAECEGGVRNGVRRAIEDFIEQREDWRFINIPSLYGMGVLWDSTRVSELVERELEKLSELFDFIRPFLATLELNRILLLSEIAQQGEEWRLSQDYITKANSRISELDEDVESLTREIVQSNGIIRKMDEAKTSLNQQLSGLNRKVSELHSKLSSANTELWESNSELSASKSELSALKSKLTEKDSQIAYLQSLKGAIRQVAQKLTRKS